MKILLLSDTHGYIDDNILKHAEWADEIWHAGDIGNVSIADQLQKIKPLKAVFGNVDDAEIRRMFPLDNRFISENLDIWITHIGGYPGKYERRIKVILRNQPPDIFICGHSHILKVMRDEKHNMLAVNPGAAGTYGFHKIRTMLRFEIENGSIKNMEVIELGKRGFLR